MAKLFEARADKELLTANAPKHDPSCLDRFDRLAAVTLLLVTVVAFHLTTICLLDWYYETHLPHYDSIGSYTMMSQVVHVTRDEGLIAGCDHASAWTLSWLQSMFAVAIAHLVTPTPAGFQLLNTLCFAVLLVSVYQAAHGLDANRVKAFLAALVILLPHALIGWDGGYQDMRRDAAFLSLLGGSFFLTLAQIWQPSRTRAIALGVIAGLCVWSRGSAAPYLVITLGPIFLLAFIQALRQGRLHLHLRWVALTTVCFLVAAGIYLAANFNTILSRELDPLTCYGRNANRWQSLCYYVRAPLLLWNFGKPLPLAVLCLGTLAVFRWKVQLSKSFSKRQWAVALAGIWTIVATLGLICLVVGWDPEFREGGLAPFYPTLIGLFATAIVAFSLIRVGAAQSRNQLTLRWLTASVVALGCVALLGYRMYHVALPAHPQLVALARNLTHRLHAEHPDGMICVLSHDQINFDTLAYFEAANGFSRTKRFNRLRWVLPSKQIIDTAAVLPADTDIAATQDLILRQILERSDYIIVNTNLEHYNRPANAWSFFLFRHGRPVVKELLADQRLEPICSFDLGPRPTTGGRKYVVLRNKCMSTSQSPR